MPGLLLLFAAAVTVLEDGAELREACDPGEPAIARLAKGTPATIKFAMNGCYSVEVTQNGQTVRGFLPGRQLDGLEAWDQARRSASSVDAPSNSRYTPEVRQQSQQSFAGLLNDNRNAEALALAERALALAPRDPQLLAAAGVAAYRNDMGVRAIGYWKDSLALRPNPAIEKMLEQALREQQADRTGEPLHSPRFVFRFDPAIMPRDTARALLGVLEQEYSRISFELGCQTPERLAVIAQTREDYLRATGAAEWSGGLFDGRIRVALLEADPGGANTRRSLAHEVVHACLAATGQWPAWLHEGLAQRLSGEQLSPARRAAIRAAAKAGELPPLPQLSASWSRLSTRNAMVAYAASLYAVELFYERHAAFGIRNLLRNPDQLAKIVMDIDAGIRE